jgi:hypothetical protein
MAKLSIIDNDNFRYINTSFYNNLPNRSSCSSSELELPADSELTNDPGLIGDPDMIDLPPARVLLFARLSN